ncbi:serine protease, partial [Streptomyces sp. NRRL F-4428]
MAPVRPRASRPSPPPHPRSAPPTRRTPHMSVMRHTRRRLAGISATAVAALALGAAAALPASAADSGAQGVIENAGAAGSVPGSYIVTLKDSAARSTADSGKAVAKRYGARIDRTYTAALNGYSVKVSEAQARKLAADPAVQSVVQDRVFTVDATQPNPPSWGLDRIDQRAL